MENAFIIRGGKKLKGEITLSGAKNIALKTIIASLMFENKVILENVPKINDVYELLNLIKSLGARAKFIKKNTLLVDGSSLNNNRVDFFYGSKLRVSFMLFAPLLYRFKTCLIPNPGGCRIGARPIDRVVEGMRSLGMMIEYNHKTGYYEARMIDKPKGAFLFPKSTHTGTELLILLSLFGKDEIILDNAALEPEIDELIKFLNEGGAIIKRDKTRIIIKGVSCLKQKKPFRIIADRNEAVTFSVLAVATRGEIVFGKIPFNLIEAFLIKLKQAGIGVERLNKEKFRFFYQGKIRAVDIETSPHPGFMTDWQPPFAVLMTQAEGVSIIHERVFENRFSYVSELQKLGARIEFVDIPVDNPKRFYFFNYDETKTYQQAIKIFGPKKLHNGVLTISDLRAGATLIIASLLAKEESIVYGATTVERGYEDFIAKISQIGGTIKRI